MLRTLALSIVFLVAFTDFLQTTAEPTWTSLRVTWGLNLFSSATFAKLPRTESKARSAGWTKLPGECSEGKFLGSRYIKNLDPAAVLIYDKNGFIAGIQTGIPEREVVNRTNFPYPSTAAYQLDTVDGDETYFITAYFVDPSIICREGRTREEYEEQGTGTGLYLQNGTNPLRDSVHIPLYEAGMNVTHWVKGGCFPSMGQHYWYEVNEHMNCDHFFPITAIYNRGKLTSFAFVSFGYFDFSSRFEHPPESALGLFLPKPIPQCVKDTYNWPGGFTSMHVFFSVRPWNVLC